MICQIPLWLAILFIFGLLLVYGHSRKTVNTRVNSGMFIVPRPIRSEMKPQKITAKPQHAVATTSFEATSWLFVLTNWLFFHN